MEAGVCLWAFWAFLLQHFILRHWAFNSLTCLLTSNLISSLSVLLKVYFTFSVSLISLIQQISKQLPSGLPSGRCYAVGCHHTVDQYSPLGFRGRKLYIFLFSFHIYIVFVFLKLSVWLSTSVLFMLKAFFKHPWLTSNYAVHFKRHWRESGELPSRWKRDHLRLPSRTTHISTSLSVEYSQVLNKNLLSQW